MVESAVAPGNSVVSFPNSADENWSTVLMSKPDTTQAGIDGRVLTVRVFNRTHPWADELTLDIDGNLGIRGTLYSRSSRMAKKDIMPYRDDALELLTQVPFVTYRYKNEPESAPAHIGFIAQEVPAVFSGPRHDSFNINNSIAVNMAATKELESQLNELRRQIVELKNQVRVLERR